MKRTLKRELKVREMAKRETLTPVLSVGNEPWNSGVHFSAFRSTSVFCAVEKSGEGRYSRVVTNIT
jgi:hypothetical protein